MTGKPEIPDSELLARAVDGDEESFTALYRRRQGAVYRFALQMSGRRSVAEEVTQEVFLAVIREAGRFDAGRGPVRSYLYGIARNHVLRCLERDRPYVAIEDEQEGDLGKWAAAEDTLGDLTRGETIESVRRAVLALPTAFREVVVLCDLHEMSYADAALAMDCAVGTVRSRLHRARGVERDERAMAHVKECGRCGARLAEEERLSAGLAAWGRASIGEQAPPAVEEKLLQAFRQEPVPSRRRWAPFAAVGAIAASVLLFRLFTAENPVAPTAAIPDAPRRVASVVPDPAEPAPVAPQKANIRRAPRRASPALDPEPEPAPAPVEAHFLPVAQGDGWTPLDGGRVVRVRLPRSALLVFGLPMNEERALEQVQADVMLSNDGLLRAIRFVQ